MSEEIVLLAWDAERACDYCEKKFSPKRPQDAEQRFCCANHRKDFFRYGAKMRIVAAISRMIDPRIAALEKRLAALEKRVPNVERFKTPSIAEVRRRIRSNGLDTGSGLVAILKPEEAEQ